MMTDQFYLFIRGARFELWGIFDGEATKASDLNKKIAGKSERLFVMVRAILELEKIYGDAITVNEYPPSDFVSDRECCALSDKQKKSRKAILEK